MIAVLRRLVSIRPALPVDVPALVRLNHAAYPDLVEEGVVWNAEQLEAHLERFPAGQLVAELDGAPVGAVSTLVLGRRHDPLAQHTWREITGEGRLTTHDPRGDTLYLADIYVDPAAWGRGVGPSLYAALRGL